jgi:hypothetical protein
MTAKHGRAARPSRPDDGPPTEDLSRPGPAGPRRIGTRPAAVPARRLRVSGRLSGLRRRTALVVAVLVAVLVVAVVAVVVGYRMATDPEPAAGTATGGHQLTYRATSSDGTVVVTYSKGNNNLDGQAKSTSPWSTAVTVTGSIAVLTVTSSTSDRANSVSCAIEDASTGQTLARKEVPPSTDATVTCVTGNLGS